MRDVGQHCTRKLICHAPRGHYWGGSGVTPSAGMSCPVGAFVIIINASDNATVNVGDSSIIAGPHAIVVDGNVGMSVGMSLLALKKPPIRPAAKKRHSHTNGYAAFLKNLNQPSNLVTTRLQNDTRITPQKPPL